MAGQKVIRKSALETHFGVSLETSGTFLSTLSLADPIGVLLWAVRGR